MTQPVTSILCPVDFSSTSEEAARYAVSLAQSVGASRITFLHVFQPPIYPLPEAAGTFLDAEAQRAIKDHFRRELEGLAMRHSGHGVEVEPKLVEGFPHPTIVDTALELGADLIVLATHGRTGLGHLLLGSVAEKVVRTSPIPVCTVRVKE
ncbi:MAG: universal stress protein [Sandaracinaceae bacterium]|nr:universal stress protein [Sandaracinaceae bacterium]